MEATHRPLILVCAALSSLPGCVGCHITEPRPLTVYLRSLRKVNTSTQTNQPVIPGWEACLEREGLVMAQQEDNNFALLWLHFLCRNGILGVEETGKGRRENAAIDWIRCCVGRDWGCLSILCSSF